MLLVFVGNLEINILAVGGMATTTTVTNQRNGQSGSDHETRLLGYSVDRQGVRGETFASSVSAHAGTTLRTLVVFLFSHCVDW